MVNPFYRYTGHFKSGIFEGQGKLEDFIHKTIYEGQFVDDKKNGKGK